MVRLKKIERHTVLYIDYYEIEENEIQERFGTLGNLFEQKDLSSLEDYKTNSEIDEVSNRQGTFETEWIVEET